MKIQNDTGVTYAANTNRYSNTQNAGSKTGRTYKNAHEYKNYLTQKYDCLRSKDYSVNINSSLLSEVMGDEKTKQWLEYKRCGRPNRKTGGTARYFNIYRSDGKRNIVI